MSYTLRGRRVAYDNIAVGTAITDEEHLSVGNDPPAQTWGQGENIRTGTDYGEEQIIVSGTALLEGENL